MTIQDQNIALLDKLGVISRPFSPQLKAAPSGIDRLKEVYYARTIQAVIGEIIGGDFSTWQGIVDWNVAKLRDLKFAFLRAGYGNAYLDNRLDANRKGCIDNNIPFGLYWYAVPTASAKVHAASFASAWRAGGGDLYPVVDLEESGGLGKTALESWLKIMLMEFTHLTGCSKLMIYSSTSFLNTYLPVSSWMYSYPLWQAAWTTNTNPPLPTAWKNRRFHQYTSKGDGNYYGAQSTYLDLNRYNGTWEQFVQEFNLEGNAPSPSPSPSSAIPCENVINMKVKATSTPFVNVRTGPGTQFQDVGDLPPGYEFTADAVAGTSAWVRVASGQRFEGYWVCVQQDSKIYCETSQS